MTLWNNKRSFNVSKLQTIFSLDSRLFSRKYFIFLGNIAQRKPTKQSATAFGGAASRAVDGNSNSQWNGRSCTHTPRQRGAWWRVDLQMIYSVAKVKITNRGDCCWTRLKNFEIRVGNVDQNPTANALWVSLQTPKDSPLWILYLPPALCFKERWRWVWRTLLCYNETSFPLRYKGSPG